MKIMLWEWRTPDVMPITCARCGKHELSSIAARIGWTFTADRGKPAVFVCPDCRADDMSLTTIESSADSLGTFTGVVKGC